MEAALARDMKYQTLGLPSSEALLPRAPDDRIFDPKHALFHQFTMRGRGEKIDATGKKKVEDALQWPYR